MRERRNVSAIARRDLLRAGGLGLLVVSGSGCDLLSTDPASEKDTPTGARSAGGKQAPALADAVKVGKLPPLTERLPAQPLEITPVSRVGTYGGEWRTALLGPADTPWLGRTVGYEQLLRWDPAFEKPIPNLATGYEVNADATEYVFSLRKGVRWSDGAPFTAEDVVFWYEAYARNKQLSPVPPDFLTTGDKPGVVTKVDDHTLRFTFPGGPNGLFPILVATAGSAGQMTTMPRHYLQRFHAEFNPDIDALVDKEGFGDWLELFAARAGTDTSNMDPRLPTLNAWAMSTELREGGRVVCDRNPYYWKTDTEGNQLPYLDRVVFNVMTTTDVMLLKALGGEIDMHARGFTEDLSNKPVLARNRDKGDYDFFTMTSLGANQCLLALNLTHKNPVLREVFQNKDFRAGLSHAINRQEIIDAVYLRQGKPYQPAPLPDSDYFNEQLAYQFTEYDPELAERYLDKAGFRQRDKRGMRLGPDGERIVITVDVVTEPKSWADALAFIKQYWAEVGVQMQVNTLDRTVFTERIDGNDHDAFVWWGPAADGPSVILEPYFYFPSTGDGTNSAFAKTWGWWYEGDERGEEPPPATRRQMELYRELRRTADPEQQTALMRKIIQIAADEFYVMGVAPLPDGYGIVRNDFHNVSSAIPNATAAASPALSNPAQYFVGQSNS